jgi:LEA14-like dessication related protein
MFQENPMRRLFRLPLFVSLLLLLAGCATLGTETAPKVTLMNLLPKEMGMLAQQYELELEILNRSPEPLALRGMSFALEINGRSFADGVSGQAVQIPGLSSGRVKAEVSSSLFGVLRQLQEFSKDGRLRLEYRLAGTLYPEGGGLGIPFSSRDELLLE